MGGHVNHGETNYPSGLRFYRTHENSSASEFFHFASASAYSSRRQEFLSHLVCFLFTALKQQPSKKIVVMKIKLIYTFSPQL